ncbi:MAG: TraB/GumN family protein [Burkholderiales bacterium]|nr:TraB/GumN family protein [Burkholderiales bacterium]
MIPTGQIMPVKPMADIVRSDKGKAFIWEIKSKTGVAYLFGTIHVGKRTFYPLPSVVEAAFKQSQRLVVEADISNSDGLGDIGSVINYKAPDSLDKHIPMPLFERLKIQLTRLNIPLEAVKPMKPFLIGGFLAVAEFSKLGYDMNFGVDGYLINKAKEDKKPIVELESQAGQLKMLNEMSPILQEAFLENAITALESGKGPDQVTGMVNAWQSGDVTLMEEVAKGVNKGMRMTDQLDDVLVHSRHADMMKKIENYLEGSVPHFIAVGSLHLVGPRGLVEMLKARGYEVKQL